MSILERELSVQRRCDTMPWLAAPYVVAGMTLVVFDSENNFPISPNILGMLMLLATAIVILMARRSMIAAAWVLSLGGVGIADLAWAWFPQSHAYSAFLYPVLSAAVMLGTGPSVLTASLVTAVSCFVAQSGHLGSDVSPALVAQTAAMWTVLLGMLASFRAERSLTWSIWEAYEEARDHLIEARNRQVELKQGLQDLELAHREVLRLNELLTAAREAIRSARQARDEFVASVTHELRTPLNLIIGFSDEILERPGIYMQRLPRQLLDDVSVIRRNSEHLAALVDDILELAEADSRYPRLSRDWADIGDIIDNAIEGIRDLIERKGLMLYRYIAKSLPSVYCDSRRIRQVITNLVTNAARFTETGSVTIRCDTQSTLLTVTVSDTGPGIEAAKLERIFEPFQQADPSIRQLYGGTGLGLAISRRFVEMHGGRISIGSTLGVGTTVTFTLPLTSEPRPSRALNPHIPFAVRDRMSRAPLAMLRPRVLVVEQGTTLTSILERCQSELDVHTVHTRRLAREIVQSLSVVAVVLDEELADGDDDLFLGALPSVTLDVPIMSCRLQEYPLHLDPGISCYLIKPVRHAQLLEKIHDIVPLAARVLIVDDDREARELLRRALSRDNQPHEILEAQDSLEALALMRQHNPDLLILDIMMPGEDGFQLLDIKKRDPHISHIPVLIVSALAPQHQPVSIRRITVSRLHGLSTDDLAFTVRAIASALAPQFADGA